MDERGGTCMETTQIPASALKHTCIAAARVMLWQKVVHSNALRAPSGGSLKGICACLSFKRYRPLAKVCVQKLWDSPSSTSLILLL